MTTKKQIEARTKNFMIFRLRGAMALFNVVSKDDILFTPDQRLAAAKLCNDTESLMHSIGGIKSALASFFDEAIIKVKERIDDKGRTD